MLPKPSFGKVFQVHQCTHCHHSTCNKQKDHRLQSVKSKPKTKLNLFSLWSIIHSICLLPSSPSEYLFVTHDPTASITARDVKFSKAISSRPSICPFKTHNNRSLSVYKL
ncbi:hypothetical protein V6Z11_A10G180800 [Gossypium hirsutum]